MTVLAKTKTSKNFRTTIPKEARAILNLKEGDEIVFFKVKGLQGRVCLRKG
jgi:AbrB family looped-hinge helix DNA binding protein